MAKLLLVSLMLTLTLLSGCSRARPDLTSPCVGADNSPCDRRPVNEQYG